MLQFPDVNYLAVLVASIATMVLGFLWYGPLFGNIWIKLSEIKDKDLEKAKQKGMGKLYFTAFVSNFVMSLILAGFLYYAQAVDIVEGLQVGFMSWLGFVATILLGSILWENKPVKLYLLNISYQLVSILLMSIILVSWLN